MNLQKIATARATLAEIQRLGSIANTPAGQKLSGIAASADELLAGRKRVPGSVLNRIERAGRWLSDGGTAFPSDAEIHSAASSLGPARFRLKHRALGFAVDHPATTGTALIGAGGAGLYGYLEYKYDNEARQARRRGPGIDEMAYGFTGRIDPSFDDLITQNDVKYSGAKDRRTLAAALALPDTLRLTRQSEPESAGAPLPSSSRKLNDDGALRAKELRAILYHYDAGPNNAGVPDHFLNKTERAHIRRDFARAGIPSRLLDEWLR